MGEEYLEKIMKKSSDFKCEYGGFLSIWQLDTIIWGRSQVKAQADSAISGEDPGVWRMYILCCKWESFMRIKLETFHNAVSSFESSVRESTYKCINANLSGLSGLAIQMTSNYMTINCVMWPMSIERIYWREVQKRTIKQKEQKIQLIDGADSLLVFITHW